MKPLLIAALIAIAPLPALAQPATERQIADARREADRLIAQASAGDLFVNITDSAVARVRHPKSGLVCSFNIGDAQNRILVFDQAQGMPRGDDVGCSGGHAEFAHTLYATRYRPAIDARQALGAAVAAIQYRFPDAKWYAGAVTEANADRAGRAPLPPTEMAHYTIELDGRPHYTAARVAEKDGWIYKQRLTVDMSKATEGQLFGATAWLTFLIDVVDGGGTAI